MPKFTTNPLLSARFTEALSLASDLHRLQVRKGPLSQGVPYLAHLMAVTSMVLEDGGDEDDAIAALLHDCVEDIGGADLLSVIERRFGKLVSFFVEALSDTTAAPGDEKADWKERKLHHIEGMKGAPESILRILAADKLHNLRSLNMEYQALGEELWQSFNAGRENTLWYMTEMNSLFIRRLPESMLTYQFDVELGRFKERVCRTQLVKGTI
jgi:(p)ppGpp synthase/HD superfamily hydrolase